MNRDTLDDWIKHSSEKLPAEACGLLVIIKGRERYFPCNNLSADHDHFVLDPVDYMKAESLGEIVGICHSHPKTAPVASQADKVSCEKSGLPWYIINPVTKKWTVCEPSGYAPPLIGREWTWAVMDCWTLTRDWYKEHGLELRDWERPHNYVQFANEPFFDDCWKTTGFYQVDIESIQRGDAVLMCLESYKINHCGVYIGDQMLLHHVRGRLSSRDIYGSWLQKSTARILRHRDWQKLKF